MIKSIHFKNFKALKDVTLPLSRFTLIVGPNGSGKSTAMQALYLAAHPEETTFLKVVTAELQPSLEETVSIKIKWALDDESIKSARKKLSSSLVESARPSDISAKRSTVIPSRAKMMMPTPSDVSVEYATKWERLGNKFDSSGPSYENKLSALPSPSGNEILKKLSRFRIFSFNPEAMIAPVPMRPNIQMESDGRNLAGVLENLRDDDHERFEALNEELGRWLPEFDRVTFETPAQGNKAFMLRTRVGQHKIKAADLSHGILFALAFLTLAYLPEPPAIMCFEEPERGIHPRLLRDIRDAMYRLCYPEEYKDKRSPSQVIATTHSPYFLDLYKDFTEEIVIANKDEQGVHFERLSDKPNINEFLQDAPLGEVWYSGILGGVPSQP